MDGALRVVDGEAGVGVGGVGETEAEGEERLLVGGLKPFVTDLGSLGVVEVEGLDLVLAVRCAGSDAFETGDDRVR